MKQSVEFDSISLTRLDNALHLSFHQQVYDYYTDGTVETETVYLTPDFLAEWKGAIDLEVDINRETTASATTLTLAELEAARDGWLSYLFQAIHTAKIMPKQAMKEAGERMAVVTDKYAGIQKEAVDRETVHIEGLLLDLSDPALAEDIETLGLGEAIEEIRMANDAYKAKSKERNVARVDDKLPLTRDARQHTDACFERACLLTKAGYIISTDAEEMAAIASLVGYVNDAIRGTKATYNQSMAQRYGAGSGTMGGGDTNGTTGPEGIDQPDGTPDQTPDETPDETPEGGGSDTTPDTGGSDTGGSDTGGSDSGSGSGDGDDYDDGGSLVG